MLKALLVALSMLIVFEASAWTYGRSFLSLDRPEALGSSYSASLRVRAVPIVTLYASLVFMMTSTNVSLYLRVAILIVVMVVYLVTTFKALRG